MSNYLAIIAKIDKVVEIPNADNIHVAIVLSEAVIVSKAWQPGMVGVFFPAGTQLSLGYAHANNLHRDSELNQDKTRKGFFETNRRVRAQPFLKVKSEGFFADLGSLSYTGADVNALKLGDRFETLNGQDVATKYVNEKTRTAQANNKTKAKKKRAVPLFLEHTDTEQFKHNLHKLNVGDLITIQTKRHGTSVRYAHLPVELTLPKWKQLINKVLPVFPEQKWDYVVGTRRVILDAPDKVGFHGSEGYRFEWLEVVKPFLSKGMTVYGEIVGYANGKPIMAPHGTAGLKDKAVAKKYGDTIVYKYGCTEGTNDFHIYRITLTTEDGTVIDFTQAQLVAWCVERNLKPSTDLVPQFVYDGDEEALLELVNTLTERDNVLTEDFVDASHISEGVIVRVDRGTTRPLFLKSKSYRFKVLEGIAQEVEVDTEDAA
jgi:hypothetical protein